MESTFFGWVRSKTEAGHQAESFAAPPDLARQVSPPGLSESAQRLRRLAGNLGRMNGRSEDEFLAIGARLQDFHCRAADIEKMARSSAGQILGAETCRDMESLRGILDRISDCLIHADGETGRNSGVLRDVLGLINHLDEPLDGFKKIIKNLHMLSTATKIESARLGGGAAGFINVADDVERLSVLIRSKSADVLTGKGKLVTMIGSTLARVTDVEAGQRAQAGMTLAKTRERLATLDGINGRATGAAEVIAACSADISGSIGEVITSLQFHDITRQQMEHVQEALDDLAARLAAEDGHSGGEAWVTLLWEAGDICELQSAQLSHSGEELARAVATVEASLRDLAQKETRMSEEIRRGMTGTSGIDGRSFFSEVEHDLVQVIAVLGESMAANRGLAGSMKEVLGAVDDIAAFVNDIEDIGSEIELIAMNSQVKAANTGAGGAALGVLAESIQALSTAARARTSAVSETLRQVTEATERLELGYEADLCHADEAEGLMQELRTLLRSVGNVNGNLLSLLARMNGAVQELSGDIDAATAGITVHHAVTEMITEVVADLDGIAREMRRLAPETPNQREPRLGNLAGRYTMHSERRVHSALFGSANVGPETPPGAGPTGFAPGAAATEDLGANVELF